MDCSLPGSSVHGISQARVLEWVAISLLQGIFPTQGSNPGLLHCRQILYGLSHQGNPILLNKDLKAQEEFLQLFLFHPNLVVHPFTVTKTTAALLLLLDLFPS